MNPPQPQAASPSARSSCTTPSAACASPTPPPSTPSCACIARWEGPRPARGLQQCNRVFARRAWLAGFGLAGFGLVIFGRWAAAGARATRRGGNPPPPICPTKPAQIGKFREAQAMLDVMMKGGQHVEAPTYAAQIEAAWSSGVLPLQAYAVRLHERAAARHACPPRAPTTTAAPARHGWRCPRGRRTWG